MPPSIHYHDEAKYDGKIDQCETDIHDVTDKEHEHFDRKKRKMDDYFLDGPTKQDDMLKSAQMAEHVKRNFLKSFQVVLVALKAPYILTYRKMLNHIKLHQDKYQ